MTSTALPLDIHHLHKSFGQKAVLQDVSFSINKGEIFGLIGLNGVGKTTLIKILLGLLQQDKGNATIFDKEVRHTATRKSLCFLPEKFHPSSFLKGREFLDLSLSYYGITYDHELAKEKALKLDLEPHVLDWKVSKYSKGMGQKLGLLSAFLSNRSLLILDEPMSGLDPSARISLKDTLNDYKKEGNTIFFSSHILSDIDEICDQIGVLHNQQMLFLGTPKAFKTKFKADNLERAFLKAIKR